MSLRFVFAGVLTLCSTAAFSSTDTIASVPDWGIAAGMRTATIPFEAQDSTVSTFVPMIFYRNEYIEINGTEGHLTLARQDDVELNALLRMRFVDLPKSIQNEFGADTADAGLQLRFGLNDDWHVNTEVLWDLHSRMHSNVVLNGEFESGSFEWYPQLGLRYKTRAFSEYYYANDNEALSSGTDLSAGIDMRYHVYSNLYLLGGVHWTYLDSTLRNSQSVDSDFESEVFLGFGFFNKPGDKGSALTNQRYWRASYGFATPSNMGEILRLEGERDPNDNRMSSIFYGHPIADSLFGYPLDIYISPGLAWHHRNTDQATGLEYILAIKAYKTFEWPLRWRVGVGEGLSYVNKITQIERDELDEKGYKTNKLLNYIDLSLDVNVGDVFKRPQWEHVWLGYSMHHRSAIFETASQFGRIKGGSNYNTIYLQWDF